MEKTPVLPFRESDFGPSVEGIADLMNSPFSLEVQAKAAEFRSMGQKSAEDLFGELCFCILAANTSAEMGLRTQLYIGNHGFINYPEEKLRDELKKVKYRFYNLRSSFIVKARPVMYMLPDIARSMDPWEAREFLVENVKGIGYKEASHFLRNVGVFRFAILDKHIIRMLSSAFPDGGGAKITSPSRYLEMEKYFLALAESLNLEPGILDLYMWKIATGKLIK
ncbi:MAG: N-glycosylase/DNA lyase [Cuniculiplasma divulgatum]|jgi:N-glycosylase/DNA lyase|nr:MAG: N-glycosylase/DNA lyase [Cuniculiplasma divulgatum]